MDFFHLSVTYLKQTVLKKPFISLPFSFYTVLCFYSSYLSVQNYLETEHCHEYLLAQVRLSRNSVGNQPNVTHLTNQGEEKSITTEKPILLLHWELLSCSYMLLQWETNLWGYVRLSYSDLRFMLFLIFLTI